MRGNTVRLRAADVPVVDSFELFGASEVDALVSFDITWTATGKVRHIRPASSDPTDPFNWAGEFQNAHSTGSFSGSNANGFSFIGSGSSEGLFAEMGTERNGFFLRSAR